MAHVYFWHSFKDSGFPARVNHAAAPIYDPTTGKAAIISVGGYHADVQERLNTPDEHRRFKSTPIDMHKLDPGRFQLNQDCKMGKVTKCCWVFTLQMPKWVPSTILVFHVVSFLSHEHLNPI